MNRPLHLVSAVLVAGALTGLIALTTDSPTILLGIFVTFAVTAALCLQYPKLVWGSGMPSLPSGVFGGGATFGGFMLGSAVGADFQFGAAVLGLGLSSFGLTTGYWLAESGTESQTAGA